MALPSSGAISLNQVNVELGRSGTAQISMGDSIVRTLFGVSSGAISMSNGYGKSNNYAPINTGAPSISGTAWIGYTLSVSSNGSWNAQPAISSYSYQWQRNGSNISGATGSSYTLTTSDYGYTIRCVVTATNSVGSTAAASNSSAAVDYPTGQSIYTSPGTYTWYRPSGVGAVSILAVGGGGGGGSAGGRGAGGGLGYRNNTWPSDSEPIQVGIGAPGGDSGYDSSKSWFRSQYSFYGPPTTIGYEGSGTGGGYHGDGGGAGGGGTSSGSAYGGGGAGGYSGKGGDGATWGENGQAGAGGAGGGGATGTSPGYWATGGGGGVGLFGAGGSGGGGVSGGSQGGGGGSGGGSGGSAGQAGGYGAGAGGYSYSSTDRPGGGGAVRVIWPGATRVFPSTNTGNY